MDVLLIGWNKSNINRNYYFSGHSNHKIRCTNWRLSGKSFHNNAQSFWHYWIQIIFWGDITENIIVKFCQYFNSVTLPYSRTDTNIRIIFLEVMFQSCLDQIDCWYQGSENVWPQENVSWLVQQWKKIWHTHILQVYGQVFETMSINVQIYRYALNFDISTYQKQSGYFLFL